MTAAAIDWADRFLSAALAGRAGLDLDALTPRRAGLAALDGTILALAFVPAVFALLPWHWRWLHTLPVEGVSGKLIADELVQYFNLQGAWLVTGVLAAAGLYFASSVSFEVIFEFLQARWRILRGSMNAGARGASDGPKSGAKLRKRVYPLPVRILRRTTRNSTRAPASLRASSAARAGRRLIRRRFLPFNASTPRHPSPIIGSKDCRHLQYLGSLCGRCSQAARSRSRGNSHHRSAGALPIPLHESPRPAPRPIAEPTPRLTCAR